MLGQIDASISWLEMVLAKSEQEDQKILQRKAQRHAQVLDPSKRGTELTAGIRENAKLDAVEDLKLKKNEDFRSNLKDIVLYSMKKRNENTNKIWQNG
ncbi:MAG: hypothetical protein AAF449_18030 [Myxococcota bacterium]